MVPGVGLGQDSLAIASLRGGGSRPTETDLERDAIDIEPETADRTALVKRQLEGGDTRACASHRSDTWFADLVIAVEWIAKNEWEGRFRKDISHIGSHFQRLAHH